LIRLFLIGAYPAGFAAKSIDDMTVLVSRVPPAGGDEGVIIGVVEHERTKDVSEFARIVSRVFEKNIVDHGGTITTGAPQRGPCLGQNDGLVMTSDFTTVIGGRHVMRSCCAILHGRGYFIRAFATESSASQEMPLLDRIIAATELREKPLGEPAP